MIVSRATRITIALASAATFGYLTVSSICDANTTPQAKMTIAQNPLISQGGIGSIDSDLYIVVRSRTNELILAGGERWTGSASTTRQVVFVSEQRVFSSGDVPSDFKLEDTVVVSFEGNRVSFLDFQTGRCGFFSRREE